MLLFRLYLISVWILWRNLEGNACSFPLIGHSSVMALSGFSETQLHWKTKIWGWYLTFPGIYSLSLNFYWEQLKSLSIDPITQSIICGRVQGGTVGRPSSRTIAINWFLYCNLLTNFTMSSSKPRCTETDIFWGIVGIITWLLVDGDITCPFTGCLIETRAI